MTPLVLVLLAAALCGCPKPAVQFPAAVATLRRVAILPPDVSVKRVYFIDGPETLDNETAVVERELPRILGNGLQSRGFTVVPARLDEADLAAAPELRKSLVATLGRCNGAFVAMRTDQPASSFGSDVGILARHAGADALLCVAYDGTEKSGGKIANDIASTILRTRGSPPRTPSATLFVALVDGTTGDVHWRDWVGFRALANEGSPQHETANFLFTRMPMRPSPP